MSTLRLVFPQWQGAEITRLVPELAPGDAARGYFLGSHLLSVLAPETSDKTLEVPVSTELTDRKAKNGIIDYDAIVSQTKSALGLLRENSPDRIVTLGGECSVSVVPFTYLAEKYGSDTAIVWIDAHPDISLPYDDYQGYHAMALAACLGKCGDGITPLLPATIDPSHALIVGLRAYEETGGTEERKKEFGIKSLSPSEATGERVLAWLSSINAKKVLVHFDMDVLDPSEIIAAVAAVPDGLKIDQVVNIIRDIQTQHEIVGLTVAEPMPRLAIKIRNMLAQLPLLNSP